MNKKIKIGFIGNGNMGGALALAVAKADYSVVLYDPDTERSASLAERTGGDVAACSCDVLNASDFVFIGVKPQMLDALKQDIRPCLDKMGDAAPVLVSMAAGTSLSRLEALFGNVKIIRIMPNTPVAAGKGMTVWCANENVSDTDKAIFNDFMKESGKVDVISENLIDAASAVSGCGPAFAYMFIEALADGGVLCGLPRDKALTYAAQTLAGAAEYLMASGEHPGKLKDNVCSPGGTTIEGVRTLEEHGFRAAASGAVIAAYEKTLDLAKGK